MDQDCVKLTSYRTGRQATSRLTADALAGLWGAGEPAAGIILRGTDGAGLRQHLHAGRSSHLPQDVPAVAVTVGSRPRTEAVLDQVLKLSGRGLVTLGQARLLSDDIDPVGLRDKPGEAGVDADGRPVWLKLAVYACDSARHDGQSMHQAISRRLHAAGIRGIVTLRGVWGFHGDHAPHGGRHVPAITIVMDTPDRVSAAFSVIDELTAERGLVTGETVAAVRAVNGDA